MEWGKGLVQKKEREEKLQSDLYEADKPLARYKNDQDLERLLKEQEREGEYFFIMFCLIKTNKFNYLNSKKKRIQCWNI